ncbi:transposase [mine drainage metagenome]|uniref:Transposase n=2 Tax=mine drainage metagenome TaxID=410659 RepID=T1CGL5_9ZZZZ
MTPLIYSEIPSIRIFMNDDPDLLYYNKPICPQCRSRSIVKNGTFIRTLETGDIIRIQRYKCSNCTCSFEARPPNHGYGKHFSDITKEKIVKGRVKTSLRKTAFFFGLIGNMGISHETIRKNIPSGPAKRMASSGCFVYDEQYVHIDGKDKFRALLKDSKNRNFVEEILDDLKEETLVAFFIRALSSFVITEKIFITTDGYHYGSILREVARTLGIRIERQRCLFHLENDLAHKIKEAGKEEQLDTAKKLVKFMFFQTKKNLESLGDNKEALSKLIEGKSEAETAGVILQLLNDLYGSDKIISGFMDFVKKNRNEVFLYLKNDQVEKTSDLAEQHFSIMSWLFKHRFKTKEGLINTSYWYHHYLSTGI